ncbi:restriction endonuclease subunit S [Blautia sp. HCP3S3_C4]|uniref:restriction endonuclease subunit S n=1 Tax=Blautia sp. HCP3S3_C4 TaxID=3438911 RepID=UPI003F89EC0D
MIDTAALRKRILDLAIQGLLTPDVTVDEGVNLKVNNILVENEIKNDIVLSDIPYDIKNTWCWIKLGWIMGIERGGSPRPIKAYITEAEDGINWIKIGDVSKDGKYIEKTKEKIIPEGEKKSRHVYPGDFLLTNSMSFGRPYISKIDGCVHDGWLILRNTEELFDMDFLYHLLSSSYVYNQFSKKASGATVDNLNIDKVADAIIPLPPVEEQKIIVEKVEEMMQYLETISKLQIMYSSDLEVLKSKIIDAGIQGKLTEQLPEDGTTEELLEQIAEEKKQLIKEKKIKATKALPEITEDEIPFEIPSNWKWVRLGDISTFKGGFAYKSNLYVKESMNQIIRLGNVKQNKLLLDARPAYISDELADETEDYRIKEKDILVTMTGTRKRGDYFFVKLIDGDDILDKRLYLNQRVGCINPFSGVLPEYLVKALQHSLIRKIIFNYETGAVNQGNLGSEEIKKHVYIPLPPVAEQKRIITRIDQLMEQM